MELQQLKYFRAVAEQEHVTQAAKKLFVSQSAVSRAVTQLEQELGVSLFHRQGRAVVLSRQGKTFLENVTRAQGILEAGRRQLTEESGKETGIVALGFLPSLGLAMVPQLLRDFRKIHPAVRFVLVQQSARELIDHLFAGGIDLCLSTPGLFDQKDVQWTHLFDEELVLTVPRKHRLASQRTVRFNELNKETFLTLSPGNTLRVILEQACAKASISPQIAFESTDVSTLRGMIAAGLGIGLLPLAPQRVPGIVEIRLIRDRPVRPLGMGYVKDRPLPPCAEEFRHFACKHLGSR
jgi:LysR family transcriptional activator of glutamate synthase operon